MLKFLTTTTALLAAAPALAAMVTPEEAREATIRVMREDPAYFEKLKAEISTGLTPDDLTCAETTPCAPGDLMLTPGGIAVRLSEGGNIYPVSRAEAGAPVVMAQAEAPAEPEAVEAAPADEPLSPIEQAITPAVPEAAPVEEEAEITPDPSPLPEPEPAAATEAPIEDAMIGSPPFAPDVLPETAADSAAGSVPAHEEALSAAPATPALESPPLADYRVPEDLAGQVREDMPAEGQQALTIEQGEEAAADAAEAAALERILTDAAEPPPVAPETADPAPVISEPAAPMEPEGRRAPTDEEMAKALEEQKALSEPADLAEPVVPAAPEAVIETPAEPAAVPADPAPPAPVVEALADEEAAEVETVSVTEEQARSSSEDFGNRVSASRDDGRLAENALFGLAGFALGQALQDRSVVTLNSGDRVVITTPEGEQRVIKDQDAVLVRPGYEVSTETYPDGSTRRTVTRPDGSRVVTVRSADLRVLYRRVIEADGTQIVLIDQTAEPQPVDVKRLPPPVAPVIVTPTTEEDLRRALLTVAPVQRVFSLDQVLTIHQVRDLAAPVAVPNITFATGSAAIPPENARSLVDLGNVIRAMIAADPRELFLIEGHTDTVGNDAANLALSDRRAESVAKALVEYFDVPAENLIVQGYGERFLLVPQEGDIRENRRASVRRITDLVISR